MDPRIPINIGATAMICTACQSVIPEKRHSFTSLLYSTTAMKIIREVIAWRKSEALIRYLFWSGGGGVLSKTNIPVKVAQLHDDLSVSVYLFVVFCEISSLIGYLHAITFSSLSLDTRLDHKVKKKN